MSNTHRALNMLEITIAISRVLKPRDLCSILCVSRLFFLCGAPLIWKTVTRVDSLMKLIPGTTIQRWMSGSKSSGSMENDITLPDILDLTRLDIYGPWVRRLHGLDERVTYTFFNISALMNVLSTRPILPGLQSLTMTSRCMPFTRLFLCPTLVEIRHVPLNQGEPYLSAPQASNFVLEIRDACPDLQELEFHTGEWAPRKSTRRLIYPSLGVPFGETLARFTNLRSLTSTAFVLDLTTFQVLGGLPLLESLTITANWGDPPILGRNLTIPDFYFPRLQHLGLHNFDLQDITILWNQASIVGNLLSASIGCNPYSANNTYEDGQKWIAVFLTSISRASPLIRELELYFDDPPADFEPYSMMGALQTLRQLPLHKIYFNEKLLSW
ncbi:hypothetical protein BDV93DRAFT_526537 [Ceratobasidium sp. AG-I]|nr:hypothetical protein BDV93DRAFT_526537 [Ceratobasidium sp. AG-I]